MWITTNNEFEADNLKELCAAIEEFYSTQDMCRAEDEIIAVLEDVRFENSHGVRKHPTKQFKQLLISRILNNIEYDQQDYNNYLKYGHPSLSDAERNPSLVGVV